MSMFDFFRKCLSNPHQVCSEDCLTKGISGLETEAERSWKAGISELETEAERSWKAGISELETEAERYGKTGIV